LAVRGTVIGVLPMVATTKLLVCLLSDITSVADTVAKNATTLRDKRIQSFFGLVSGTTLKPDSIFSSFPEAIVIVYSLLEFENVMFKSLEGCVIIDGRQKY
jgi:hypothetical protein